MATSALQGSATLSYDPGGGVITHTLAVPLKDIEPVDNRTRHEWWSGDNTNREIVNIGDEVREIHGTVRFENEPGALKDLLRSGLEDDVTITYTPTSGGTTYDAKLVKIVGSSDVELQKDADRHGFGEYQVRIHLRRVDSGSFDALL